MSLWGKSRYNRQLDESERQLEMGRAQLELARAQAEQYERQQQEAQRQVEESAKIQEIMRSNAERFSALLDTWEQQSEHLDTILSKLKSVN